MVGWIKIHRKLQSWEWYTDSQVVHLFLHFLLEANHEDRKWKGVMIKRGQLIFGRKRASETLGISEQSLRTCITKLKSTSEITIKSTNRFSLVTVVNYEYYQCMDDLPTSKSTSKSTNDQPTTNQQPTTPKEYKEDKKKIKTRDDSRAQKFVDFVNQSFSRKYRCTPKIKEKFNARMKDYPPGVLADVVKNIKASTYHIDTEFKYATPEFLLREDKIEKYKSGPIKSKIISFNGQPEPKTGQKYDPETDIFAESI